MASSFQCFSGSTVSPHGGSYAYAISNQANGHLLSDAITVSANRQYDVYAWVIGKLDANDSFGTAEMKVLFYDRFGAQLGSGQSYTMLSPGLGGGLWQSKGGRVTTPANTTQMKIMLTDRLNAGWVSYDDVSVVDPNGGGANLAPNPGFESSGNWTEVRETAFPGTAFYRAGDGPGTVHGGSSAYTLGNLESDAITVGAEMTYDIFAWVRSGLDSGDSGGSRQLKAVYYDSTNAMIGQADVDRSGTETQAWEQRGGRIVTPANTAKLRLQLWKSY